MFNLTAKHEQIVQQLPPECRNQETADDQQDQREVEGEDYEGSTYLYVELRWLFCPLHTVFSAQ